MLGSALSIMFKVNKCSPLGLFAIKDVMLAIIVKVYIYSMDNSNGLLTLIVEKDTSISIQDRPQGIE